MQLTETVYIHDSIAKVNRNMSIHFNMRFFKGFKHEDIVNELEKEIQRDDIKSLQLTEKNCIVTLNSAQAKIRLLTNGIVNSTEVKIRLLTKDIVNSTEAKIRLLTKDIVNSAEAKIRLLTKDIVNSTEVKIRLLTKDIVNSSQAKIRLLTMGIVNSAEVKIRLLTKGFALQNRSHNFFEIDKKYYEYCNQSRSM